MISLMVWQLDVPGEQTVTLTQGLLAYEPDEQSEPFTVTASTFSPEDALLPLELGLELAIVLESELEYKF